MATKSNAGVKSVEDSGKASGADPSVKEESKYSSANGNTKQEVSESNADKAEDATVKGVKVEGEQGAAQGVKTRASGKENDAEFAKSP